MKRTLAFMALALACAACQPAPGGAPGSAQDGQVFTYVDSVRHNTCYIITYGVYGGASVAISCIQGR